MQGAFGQVDLGQKLRLLAVCQVQRVEAQSSCDAVEDQAGGWVKEFSEKGKLTRKHVLSKKHMAMDRYLYIPFLGG